MEFLRLAAGGGIQDATDLLLGVRPDFPGVDYSNQAKAWWLFDKISKNFIVRCWKAREAVAGRIRIVAGHLEREDVARQRPFRRPLAREFRCDAARAHEWLALLPGRDAPARERRPPCNFYVVWSGAVCGIFHKYGDVRAAVSGFPGAKFRGCASLSEARRLLAAGPG